MIFIGRNYKGEIISIISAKSQESANAYWQGKGIIPHAEEIWDDKKIRDNEEKGYVTPILKTEERALKGIDWDTSSSSTLKYVIVIP